MKRKLIVLLALLFASGCVDRDPTNVESALNPQDIVSQRVGFHFLPPIGSTVSSAGFLGTLSPEVLVCIWNGTACDGGTQIAHFTLSGGTGGAAIAVMSDNSYQVNWKTDETDPGTTMNSDATYQIVVRLGGGLLGTADIRIFANMGQARKASGDFIALQDGRTLPIKFGIRQEAIFDLLGVPGSDVASSNDVVVETFSTENPEPQRATVPSGEAAFEVDGDNIVMPEGHEGTEFTLLIYEKNLNPDGTCTGEYNGPNTGGCYGYATIPEGVEFVDNGEAAGIVGVCPAAGLGDEYTLTKLSDGVIEFLDESPVNVVSCGGIGMRLPAALRKLANLLLPAPLHAKDLGESGMVRAFSTVFWAAEVGLEENPAAPLPTSFIAPGQTVPLSFRVMSTHDHDGELESHPVEDVVVDFTVAAGNGSLSSSSAVSDANGVVSVDWTAPNTVGTYEVTATINGAGRTINGAGDTVPPTLVFTGTVAASFGSIIDAAGDAGAGLPDLVSANVSVSGSSFVVVVNFAPGTMSSATVVDVMLDTDANTATGYPGLDSGNNDSNLIGADRMIRTGSETFNEGTAFVLASAGGPSFTSSTPVAEAIEYGTDQLTITVPLTAIGNPWGVRFKLITYNQLSSNSFTGVADYMTNIGLPAGITDTPIM